MNPTPANLRGLMQRICRHSWRLRPRPTHAMPKVRLLPHIKAVLLDVYGTMLISTAGEPAGAGREHDGQHLLPALRAAGLQPLRGLMESQGVELLRQEIVRRHTLALMTGDDRPEINIQDVWRRVLQCLQRQAQLVPTVINSSILRTLAVEYECRVNPVWPMPGVRATLSRLRRAGCLLGIVSNAQFYTPLTLEALFRGGCSGLGLAPQLCVWSYEQHVAKPAPALYVEAWRRLLAQGVRHPREVLMVGNDMVNDILPAAALGFRTALFAGDARSLRNRRDDPRCCGLRPDATITHFRQLELLCLRIKHRH